MDLDSRIFVAGHRGLVGAAIVRHLAAEGFAHVITRTRAELDLTDQAAVEVFFSEVRPDHVFLAAARVGGIHANSTWPAEFLRDNLAIQTNVIDSAFRNGTRRLAFLGSSCIYPKLAEQPIREDALLTGPLEPTNEWYAIAKIAGLKLCQAHRLQYGHESVIAMPTNLYGPGDNFHPETSHVVPGLIRRFHEAKLAGARSVTIWGTGMPLREFLHADDLADALVFLMRQPECGELTNVGSGEEVSIAELARTVARVVGFDGELVFDATKPDGTPRKLLDSSRLRASGWKPRRSLEEGLAETYRWFVESRQGPEAT